MITPVGVAGVVVVPWWQLESAIATIAASANEREARLPRGPSDARMPRISAIAAKIVANVRLRESGAAGGVRTEGPCADGGALAGAGPYDEQPAVGRGAMLVAEDVTNLI